MRRNGRCGLSGISGSVRLLVLVLNPAVSSPLSMNLRIMPEEEDRSTDPDRKLLTRGRLELVEPDRNRNQRRSAYEGREQILMAKMPSRLSGSYETLSLFGTVYAMSVYLIERCPAVVRHSGSVLILRIGNDEEIDDDPVELGEPFCRHMPAVQMMRRLCSVLRIFQISAAGDLELHFKPSHFAVWQVRQTTWLYPSGRRPIRGLGRYDHSVRLGWLNMRSQAFPRPPSSNPAQLLVDSNQIRACEGGRPRDI